MQHHFIRRILLAIALAVNITAVFADSPKEVTIAYQQIISPWLVAVADGTFEKTTGYKINWKMIEDDAEMIKALASGQVQIGAVSSSPFVVAVAQDVDLQLFWIIDDINNAEALVVRNDAGITKPTDLKGKTICVPFTTTSHYHLMFALKQWNIQASEVALLNLRPAQCMTAWENKKIDAAYIWNPTLAQMKKNGTVLITSGELEKLGKVTFDGFTVDRQWGETHKEFMTQFVKIIADTDQQYRTAPQQWSANSPQAAHIAKLIGDNPADVPDALALYAFPSLQQQASAQWLGGGARGRVAVTLKDTANFMYEQKQLSKVLPDYSRFVNPEYVEAALHNPKE